MIAACVGSLGVGVIGEAAFTLTTPSCYARHDTASPLRAMGLRLAIVAIGAAIAPALALLDPALGCSGARCVTGGGPNLVWPAPFRPSLAASCAPCTAASPLETAVSGVHFSIAMVSLVPAWLLADWLGGEAAAGYARVAQAVGVLATAIVSYLAIQFLLGSPEMRLLLPVGAGRWAAPPRQADM